MLRIVEQAHRTDTGRQRNANEDAYFAAAPVFAVADGMGGAQAGEVASRLAAESFEPVERGEESAEQYLRAIAKTANARIHRLAQSDSSRSGMGTTLTAALVEDDEVSFAHVGDSRAYRFRDGELKLLTSDHSLVEELRRQGRLTDEQAEDHPQRSIITRALGPERDVDVDTMTYQARPGDVYLLCSDGLTTMLKDDRIASALRDSSSLEEAVRALVEEANAAGGRDNITVVAFRLEEAEVPAEAEAEPATLIGPTAEEAGLPVGAVSAEGEAARAAGRAPRQRAELGGAAAPGRERRWPRRLVTSLVVVVILGLIVGGAAYGLRHVYFVGSDDGGRIALYRGLPYNLPLGINLYSEIYAAPVQVSALPADRRHSVTDNSLRKRSDAISLLQDLQAAAEPPVKKRPAGGNQGGGSQSAVRSPQKQGNGQKKSGGQNSGGANGGAG
jgi:PPM family protein phosphatase